MEKLLFIKKVDKSLLKDGLTIPVEKHDEVLTAVGAVLVKGSRITIDIWINGIAYPAILTHVNFSESPRDVYQIRYSPNSDICKKINELFGKGTGVNEIEVWANDHRNLLFYKAR